MAGDIAGSLRALIEVGATDGHKSREEKRLALENKLLRQREERITLRVTEVMAALPQLVADAVAGAAALPGLCTMMVLQADEYADPVSYDFSRTEPCPEPAPSNLRMAGAVIFEQLRQAGYSPTLYFGTRPGASLPIRFQSLCMRIAVR